MCSMFYVFNSAFEMPLGQKYFLPEYLDFLIFTICQIGRQKKFQKEASIVLAQDLKLA